MLQNAITGMTRDLLIIYMTGVAVGAMVFTVRHREGSTGEGAGAFWNQAFMHTLGWASTVHSEAASLSAQKQVIANILAPDEFTLHSARL